MVDRAIDRSRGIKQSQRFDTPGPSWKPQADPEYLGTDSLGGGKGLEGASEDRAKELGSTGRGLQTTSLANTGQAESSKMASLSDTERVEDVGVGGRVGTSQ